MILAFAYLTWRGGRLAPLVLAMVIILAMSVIWLYLRQASRWKLSLILLRMTALSVLALSLLRPALLRDANPTEQGAIVVIVDHSHSMGTHDQTRSGSELVALADGLGLISPSLRSGGDEWRALASELERGSTQLTDSQSRLTFARISGMSTHDAEADLDAATAHLQEIEHVIQQHHPSPASGSPLANALAKLHQALSAKNGPNLEETWLPAVQIAVDGVTDAASTYQSDNDHLLYSRDPRIKEICDQLSSKSWLQISELALTYPTAGILYHLPGGVPVWGFAAANTITPLPLYDQNSRPVRRLLLDTDERSMDLAQAVRDSLDHLHGGAVRAVVLFSDGRQPGAPSDRMPISGAPIFAIYAGSTPQAQVPTLADVSIPTSAHAGEHFSVRAKVFGNGSTPGRKISVRCETALQAAQIKTVVMDQRGEADIAFDVSVNVAGPQRIVLQLPQDPGEGNTAERWIKILSRRTQIDVLSDVPTWDWRTVYDALAQNPGLEVRSILITPDLKMRESDAVILLNAHPISLNDHQWQHLQNFVHDGGLLIMAGGAEHSLDDSHPSGITDLLPFSPASTAWSHWHGDQAVYRFGPVAASKADRLAWASLPPAFCFLPLSPLKTNAQPLLVEDSTGSTVMAQMTFGQGHALFLGVDETWRWHYAGNKFAENFWSKLIERWSEVPYAISEDGFSLDVDRASVGPHDPISIRARLPSGQSGGVRLRVLKNADEIQQLPLLAASHNCFTATLGPLPLGDYTLQAVMIDNPKKSVQYALHVIPLSGDQQVSPVQGREILKRLAEGSGGRMSELDQLRQLPSMLAGTAETRYTAVRLWDSPYLFALVVGCLALEWTLRKWIGLA